MTHEIEVKIAVKDAGAVAARLEEAGARLVAPRRFEDNRLYDTGGGALAAAGRLLRLRRTGGRAVLTAKAPAEAGAGSAAYKVRREAEVEVSDAEATAAVLETAGLEPAWRYQKYRATWELHGATVTLDEIPHGCFLEIEGDPARIDAVAARLGLDRSAYRTESYAELHARRCAEQGRPLGDMVFRADGREPEA
jgi:adenylate cyclase class 2